MKQAFFLSAMVCLSMCVNVPSRAFSDPDLNTTYNQFNSIAGAIPCGLQEIGRNCNAGSSGGAIRVAVDAALAPKTQENVSGGTGGLLNSPQVLGVTSARKVNIRFLGYKELTGEYSINADATVSIPVLGRVSVANIDLAQLERVLSQKVTSVTGRKGYATVEVISYRPIFVTGIVKRSKSYDWTPGMTVLHAITLAGGTSRLGSQGMSIPLSTNVERSRLQQATNKLKRSLAQLTRLRAERLGKNELVAPPLLVELVGSAEAKDLIKAQMDMLKADNGAYTNQFEAIQQAIKTATGELQAMKTQRKLVQRQHSLRLKHYRRIKKLKKRGLVSNTALIEMETKIAETEEKSISLVVARANLKGRLLDLQRELLVVRQKKEGAIEKQILRLEREIAEQQINMSTARKAVRTLTGGLAIATKGGKPKQLRFEIVRETRKGARTYKVNKFTRLLPGDIVVVSK